MLNQFLPHMHLQVPEFLILTENPACSPCTDCPLITAVSEDAGAVSACENCGLVFQPSSVKGRIHLHHCLLMKDPPTAEHRRIQLMSTLAQSFYIPVEALNLLPKSFSSTEKPHLPPGLNNSLGLQVYAQLYLWKTSLLLTYQVTAYRHREPDNCGNDTAVPTICCTKASAGSLCAREMPRLEGKVISHIPDHGNLHMC